MASCLGLYIENNLIKYAKVSKEKDGFRMDSYGIKFYSNINEAIEQIVHQLVLTLLMKVINTLVCFHN